jgi:hypothetical protein
MGDSSTFGDVPKRNIDIVAVYDDGKFGVPLPGQLELMYPHEQFGHCWIDVNGSHPEADVRDWETGDKGGSLEQWVIDHNRIHGQKNAVVYCNVSTIPEVRKLTGAQILAKDYFLFIATLDGTEYRRTGVIACQNKGQKQTGGHYDSSKVYDDRFWKKTGQAAPHPNPTPHRRPNCKPFQKALRIKADDIWGPETNKAAGALIHATENEFPYGINFAQKVVGTARDGMWGNDSRAQLRNTVTVAQNAIRGMGFKPGASDGIWGPKTNAAYILAKAACKR